MTATASPSALERAIALLAEPPASPPPIRDGYLDLLGDAPSGAPTIGQAFMTSRLLPLIYERLWRPIGVRLAFGGVGVGGPIEQRATHEYLDLQRDDVVLDIACGPGNITRQLLESLGSTGLVVGIDASPTMLARAVQDTNAVNAAYMRADAERLPFADASFNAVCCYAALYLIGDPFAAIEEMARVLAPGGRVAVLTSVHRGPEALRPVSSLTSVASGVRVFGRHEVTDAFERAGLVGVRQQVAGLAQFVGARKP
jgi:ubiquinone/menaquinone biosynthesis C-methylase UbiE